MFIAMLSVAHDQPVFPDMAILIVAALHQYSTKGHRHQVCIAYCMLTHGEYFLRIAKLF